MRSRHRELLTGMTKRAEVIRASLESLRGEFGFLKTQIEKVRAAPTPDVDVAEMDEAVQKIDVAIVQLEASAAALKMLS